MYGDNIGPKVPSGEIDYLTKAAEMLAKTDAGLGDVLRYTDRIDARIRIARGYALLGAIQRGVLPQEMAKELFDSVTSKSS